MEDVSVFSFKTEARVGMFPSFYSYVEGIFCLIGLIQVTNEGLSFDLQRLVELLLLAEGMTDEVSLLM